MKDGFDLHLLELDDVAHRGLVRHIVSRASTELARRQAESNPLLFVGHWLRPVLAAAILLIIASGAVITRGDAVATQPVNGIVEALAVPQPADAWLVADREPNVNDLLLALERDGQ